MQRLQRLAMIFLSTFRSENAIFFVLALVAWQWAS
jgi:hypothetical protein